MLPESSTNETDKIMLSENPQMATQTSHTKRTRFSGMKNVSTVSVLM
jgi:hypothetical protein